MWSAIRNDLFEFVHVVTNDTKVTLTKVLGEDAVDDNKDDGKQQKVNKILELQRSRQTYSLSIEDTDKEEYSDYFKSFSLSSKANEISQLIEREGSVSKYYSDLVPAVLTPEEFWSRYFFRYKLLMKSNAVNLTDVEELDEEDISWETSDTPTLTTPITSPSFLAVAPPVTTSLEIISPQETPTAVSQETYDFKKENEILNEENQSLKLQVRLLTARILELEDELKKKESVAPVVSKTKLVNNKSSSLTTATKLKKTTKESSKKYPINTDTGKELHVDMPIALPIASEAQEKLVKETKGDIVHLPHPSVESQLGPSVTGGGGVEEVEVAEVDSHILLKNTTTVVKEMLPHPSLPADSTNSTSTATATTAVTSSVVDLTVSVKGVENEKRVDKTIDISDEESDENWSTSWS